MKQLTFFLLLLISISALCQENLPGKKIQLSGGYSKTGSGDLPGFMFGAAYSNYFKEKLSWSAGFNGFIYDGEDLYPKQPRDAGYRYATAGVQLTGHLGFAFIRTSFHEFQFKVGPLLKYQTDSQSGYSISTPQNYPEPAEPVFMFINFYPQRNVAIGGSVQLDYNYTIKDKICIGFLAGGQIDTNGDLITQAGLIVGRKF